jgi:hypothetical protein
MLKHGMSRNAGVSRLLSHCFGSYRETRQAAALQPTKQVRRLETTVADLRKQLDKEALLRESLRADLQVPFVFSNACPHTPRVLRSKSYARTRSHRMHASAARCVCAFQWSNTPWDVCATYPRFPNQAERQKSKQLRASLRECDITAQQAAKEATAAQRKVSTRLWRLAPVPATWGLHSNSGLHSNGWSLSVQTAGTR